MSAKLKSIEKDIERSRLQGTWNNLPELARRYKKHEPKGEALQHILLAEYSLDQVTDSIDHTAHDLDHPSNITLPKPSSNITLTRHELAIALDNVETAIKACSPNGSFPNTSLFIQANIIKAKCFFACDSYEDCKSILGSINLLENKENDDLNSGYARALYIQGLTLYGLCMEIDNRIEEAIEFYSKASQLIYSDFPPSAVELSDSLNRNASQLNLKNDQEVRFSIENVLYRLPLLLLRQSKNAEAVTAFRIYFSESSIWGKAYRPHKQLVILRYFLLALTQAYKRGEHVPALPQLKSADLKSKLLQPNPKQESSSTSIYSPDAFRDELNNIQTRYEGFIHQLSSFPSAGKVNSRVLDMADQFVSNYKLLPNARANDTRALVDSLYRATKLTYQSPRILRHLLTALTELGEYKEAKLAVDSYVSLVESSVAVKATCILDATQESAGKSEFTMDASELAFWHSLPPVDKEPLSEVLSTYLLGCKLYIQEFEDYDRAIKLASLAIQHGEARPNHHLPLISRAYQYLGVSKGCLAMTADNPKTRNEFHKQSLDALNRSVTLNADNWEGHYFLALQQAEGRDINEAIFAVKKSLELHPTFTASWHLLVLLMSCQRQYDQAIGICDVAIREAELETTTNQDESSTLLGLLTPNLDGEDLLALKVTLNLLQDIAMGTKVAINHHGALFALYAKVYGNLDQNNQAGGSVQNLAQSTINRRDHAGTEVDLSSSPNRSNPIHSSNTFPRSRLTPTATEASSLPRPTSIAGAAIAMTHRSLSNPLNVDSPYGPNISTRSLPRLLSRKKRGTSVLTSLWLLSADLYRKLGKYSDSQSACQEAEANESTNPDVWCMYGKLFLAQNQYDLARACLDRAILLDPNHVPALTHLGQVHLQQEHFDLAEACLSTVTSGLGWSSTQAWYLLGKVYRLTNRAEQAQQCLLYAMDLDQTAPIRPFQVIWSLKNLS